MRASWAKICEKVIKEVNVLIQWMLVVDSLVAAGTITPVNPDLWSNAEDHKAIAATWACLTGLWGDDPSNEVIPFGESTITDRLLEEHEAAVAALGVGQQPEVVQLLAQAKELGPHEPDCLRYANIKTLLNKLILEAPPERAEPEAAEVVEEEGGEGGGAGAGEAEEEVGVGAGEAEEEVGVGGGAGEAQEDVGVGGGGGEEDAEDENEVVEEEAKEEKEAKEAKEHGREFFYLWGTPERYLSLGYPRDVPKYTLEIPQRSSYPGDISER
jgi:hypothetical protein